MKCPNCQTEYEIVTPGKYKCSQCSLKFTVDENLTVLQDVPVTVFPLPVVNDPDKTIPGKRNRKSGERLEIGDLILNRYKIISELGQGGMGVVYRCLDETAGVEIALKVLPPELSHSSAEIEDIKDNFQLVSKLVHQNIAIMKQLEKDPVSGDYLLIMEYCEGEDLRRWIRRKRKEGEISLEELQPIIRQIADVLDYAHSKGLIHRDIKPGNIIIDRENNIKVLDFGLAAQIHTSMSHVSMGYQGTSGTGPYMAPEQWRGKAQGAAADQYALAVMTYEMIAGHLPFENPDTAILRQAVLEESPDEIPGLSKIQQLAITRALRKDPAERFQTCSDFAKMLEGTEIPDIKPAHKIESIKKKTVWKYSLIGLGSILLLTASGIIGGYLANGTASKNGKTSIFQKNSKKQGTGSGNEFSFDSLSDVVDNVKDMDDAVKKFNLLTADFPQNIMDIQLVGKPEIDEKKGTEGDMINMVQKVKIEVNYQKYVQFTDLLKKIYVPFAKDTQKGVWTRSFDRIRYGYPGDHVAFLYPRTVGKFSKNSTPDNYTFESYQLPKHLLDKTFFNKNPYGRFYSLEYSLFNDQGKPVFLKTFYQCKSNFWYTTSSSGNGGPSVIFVPFVNYIYLGIPERWVSHNEDTLYFKIHKDDLKQVRKSGIKAIRRER